MHGSARLWLCFRFFFLFLHGVSINFEHLQTDFLFLGHMAEIPVHPVQSSQNSVQHGMFGFCRKRVFVFCSLQICSNLQLVKIMNETG